MKSSASTHESPVDRFVTTRWTMILSAARNSSPNSAKALADLCQSYWYPLYAFVRRQGYSREDAEDLVQGFFARLMEADFPRQSFGREGAVSRISPGLNEALHGQ